MSDSIGQPVRAYCSCGDTWVFLGWPMRPCGRCREYVTIVFDKDSEETVSE